MADIVNSLFGLSTNDIHQKKNEEFKAFQASLVANAKGNRAKAGAALGAGLGKGLANAATGWLGIQDPELERAATIEKVLKDTQDQLGEGVQDPAVLYPTLQKNLNDAGFSREAMQLGEVSQKAFQQKQLNTASIQEKQASAQTKQFELQAKQDEANNIAQYKQDISTLDPASPTYQQDVMQAALKYAPPEKIYTALQSSQDKEAYRVWATKQQDDLIEARIQAAQQRGATQEELIRLRSSLTTEAKVKAEEIKANTAPTNPKLTMPEKLIAHTMTTAMHEASVGVDNLSALTKGGKVHTSAGAFSSLDDSGVMGATSAVMGRELTPQDRAVYESIMIPLVRITATVQNGGRYKLTEGQIKQETKAITTMSGHSHETMLAKMGEMKQTIKAAAEATLVSRTLNPEQAELVKKNLELIDESIPWTVKDVVKFTDRKDKNVTFEEFLNKSKKSEETSFTLRKGFIANAQQEQELAKAIKVVSDGKLSKSKAKAILLKQGIKVD